MKYTGCIFQFTHSLRTFQLKIFELFGGGWVDVLLKFLEKSKQGRRLFETEENLLASTITFLNSDNLFTEVFAPRSVLTKRCSEKIH